MLRYDSFRWRKHTQDAAGVEEQSPEESGALMHDAMLMEESESIHQGPSLSFTELLNQAQSTHFSYSDIQI